MRVCAGGRQQRSLADQNVHLLRGHQHVVNLIVIDMGRGGADQRDGVTRHRDVGVCRFAAAVDHHVVDAVAEDQQRPFGREHADAQVSVFGDLLAPDAGGVDHHRRMQLITPLILMVVNAHARHPVAAAQQPHHRW